MSQSIRVGSGLVPILQHVPNTSSSSSSSCMFLSTGHTTEVGFPTINLSSVKECRKRAAWSSVVSNRNPRLPFHPCAATLKSSFNVDLVDVDGGTNSSSSNKGKGSKYNDPLKVVLLGVSQVWWKILSHIRSALRYWMSKLRYRVSKSGVVAAALRCWISKLRYRVSMGVVATMIHIDLRDPIDGLKVLLDVSQTWRMILSLSDDLYDGKGFDDYGESYHRKALMMEGGKHRNPPLKLTKTWLSMLRVLADLDDPFDGLKFLVGDFEFWRTVFSSNRLNDTEGYLQKEIFALRDLSQRAQNRYGKHDEGKHDDVKNPPSQTTHVLELLKFKIDNFEDPSDVFEAMRESFRSRDETSGPLVAADAKLNFDDNDGYL